MSTWERATVVTPSDPDSRITVNTTGRAAVRILSPSFRLNDGEDYTYLGLGVDLIENAYESQDVISADSAKYSTFYLDGRQPWPPVAAPNMMTFLNNTFGKGSMTNGVDYYSRLTSNQEMFPTESLMEWGWPSEGGSGFAWGYIEIFYGGGPYGYGLPNNAYGPWHMPQRISECGTMKVSYDITLGGNTDSYDVLIDIYATTVFNSTSGAHVIELSFFPWCPANMPFVGTDLVEFSWGWARCGLHGGQALFMPCDVTGTAHRSILTATNLDLLECYTYAVAQGWVAASAFLRGAEFGVEMQIPSPYNSAPYNGTMRINSLTFDWPAAIPNKDVIRNAVDKYATTYMAGRQPYPPEPPDNKMVYLNNPFGKGSLVNGVNYFCRLIADQTTFPVGALMDWAWPSTGGSGFAFGYNEIFYGGGPYGYPIPGIPGPWDLPQRVIDCATLLASWDITLGGNTDSYNALLDIYLTVSPTSTNGAHVIELSFFPHCPVLMQFIGALSTLHQFSWGYARIGKNGGQVLVMPCNSTGASHVDMLAVTDIDMVELMVYCINKGWITGQEYIRGAEFGVEMQIKSALNTAPLEGTMLINGLSYDWPSVIATPAYPLVSVGTPVISGSTLQGSTLTCTGSAWTGYPVPTLAYQWQRDAVNIDGATTTTHITTADDVGRAITCVVTATTAEASDTKTSNAITPVWTPILLFADEFDGAWYEFGTTPKFQSITGTGTPCNSNGQICGFITDSSGMGHHLKSDADSDHRPFYNIASGIASITFNGNNNLLNSATGFSSDVVFVASGLTVAASGGDVLGVLFKTNATANNQIFRKADATNFNAGSPGTQFFCTSGLELNGQITRNYTPAGTPKVALIPKDGTSSSTVLHMGNDGAGGGKFAGAFVGALILMTREPTAGEKTSIRDYLKIKTGVNFAWYVDGDVGSSGDGTSWATAWKTLGDITSSVVAGDIVYISGGTYSETSWTPIQGTVAKPVIYRVGQDAGHVDAVTITLVDPIGGATLTGIYIDGNYGGARNLTLNADICQPGTTAINGMRLSYATHNGRIGCTSCRSFQLDHCYIALANGSDNYFTSSESVGNIGYTNNLIHHNEIYLTSTDNFDGHGDDGFQWIENVSFYENIVISVPVATYLGTQHQDFIQTNGSYVAVYNNYFENAGNYPLYGDFFGSCAHWRVYNNVSVGIGGVPLQHLVAGFESTPDVVADDMIFANNTIYDTENTHLAVSLGGGFSGNKVTNSYIVNNLCYNTSVQAVPGTGGSITESNNYEGTTNITFVNASAYPTGDFHLQDGSTNAIDQGIAPSYLTSIYTTDKGGVTRPVGPSWDIGAYERTT